MEPTSHVMYVKLMFPFCNLLAVFNIQEALTWKVQSLAGHQIGHSYPRRSNLEGEKLRWVRTGHSVSRRLKFEARSKLYRH